MSEQWVIRFFVFIYVVFDSRQQFVTGKPKGDNAWCLSKTRTKGTAGNKICFSNKSQHAYKNKILPQYRPSKCFKYHLTFPLQIIAVVDELQWVRLIGSLHVVYVDVQVIWRFQEVVRQHRALALIQGEVHVRGDQGATLTLSHGLAHIQGGGGIWTGRPTKFRYRIKLRNSIQCCVFILLTGSVVSEATWGINVSILW